MKIRLAESKDVKTIMSLVETATIKRDSTEKTGLVEYPKHSNKWWVDKIEGNSHFYVLEDDDLSIMGLIAAYDAKFLASRDFSGDEIVEHILKNKKGKYTYVDILVIAPESRGKGYLKMLISTVLDDLKGKEAYAAVSHAPFRNESAIKVTEFFDMTLEEEITTKDGLTFGIYYWMD